MPVEEGTQQPHVDNVQQETVPCESELPKEPDTEFWRSVYSMCEHRLSQIKDDDGYMSEPSIEEEATFNQSPIDLSSFYDCQDLCELGDPSDTYQALCKLMTPNEAKKRAAYMYVRVKFSNTWTVCNALCDSGNTLGTCVSEKFAKAAGLRITSYDKPMVAGTAAAGGKVSLIGYVPAQQFRIEGIPQIFADKVMVVRA